jgi:predicted GNAT family acetyltransferase
MTAVSDNAAQSRFEMSLSGGDTAFVIYRREPDAVWLLHAEVPARVNGLGIGGRLVRATLDHLHAEGARVVPRCSFIRAFMDRHPEYDAMRADR